MIPKLHYITQGQDVEQHLTNIQMACTYGTELVQLRLKNMDKATILKAAEKAREITNAYQTRLIINDHYSIAKIVKADGVHLGKLDACPSKVRNHLYSWQIVGGTANSIADCKTLIQKRVDYIGLGPLRYTPTKQNLGPLLGIDGYINIFKALSTKIPLLAIGGITIADVPELLNAGIYGLASSGTITRNFNSVSQFHKMLQTATTQEQIWKPKMNE